MVEPKTFTGRAALLQAVQYAHDTYGCARFLSRLSGLTRHRCCGPQSSGVLLKYASTEQRPLSLNATDGVGHNSSAVAHAAARMSSFTSAPRPSWAVRFASGAPHGHVSRQ